MARGRKPGAAKANGNGAKMGFEATLWQAADALRGNMDASEYKHVVLGLIFLKYISNAFAELHDKLAAEPNADPEDRDEYLAQNAFWVPRAARWDKVQAAAKTPGIGKVIDDAMDAIEKENPSLRGVLPKDDNHPVLDTIHRFKGLDAPVVVLTGLDGLREETAQALLYVGLTRARSYLIVVERAAVLERWGLGRSVTG